MDGANHGRDLRGVEFETELSRGVGLGAARFFHPLSQLEYDDFVSRGWLAGSGILPRAAEGLGGDKRGQQEDDERDADARAAFFACRGWLERGSCSARPRLLARSASP